MNIKKIKIMNTVTPEDIEDFFIKNPNCESALDYFDQAENGICVELGKSNDVGIGLISSYLTEADAEKFIAECCDYDEMEVER